MLGKTFSAPARSASMQSLSTIGMEPFAEQKTDLIAELKMSKDITGNQERNYLNIYKSFL